MKFCLLFTLYIGTFFGLFILATVYMLKPLVALNVFTAKSVQIAAKLLGMHASASSSYLTVKGFSIEVITECTGLFAAFVFLACVLAYPTKIMKKVFGIIAGIFVIYILNIMRMICLIMVGIWTPQHFDFVHVYLWEGVFIIVVLMLWLVWLDKVVKDVRKVAVSG
ncbi:MAG: exosortase H [Gemmatimonadota bacterium]|nr:MAG: exosortase H [Gemmatimonadota bacterium]